jgi:predicted transcriptional regulator
VPELSAKRFTFNFTTVGSKKNPKQAALNAIEHLKDSASYDEIMYQVYVLQKIERGREDVRAGRTVSHDEAKERLSRWLK